ncbi:uncharacterized protein sst5 [Vanacampus margaritifer]
MLQPQVLLVLLLSAGVLVQVGTGAPDAADLLAEALGAEAALDRVWARSLLLRLIYEVATSDQALPELGVTLMRRNLPLSQRERKAGCRNFFWKTFTSC